MSAAGMSLYTVLLSMFVVVSEKVSLVMSTEYSLTSGRLDVPFWPRIVLRVSMVLDRTALAVSKSRGRIDWLVLRTVKILRSSTSISDCTTISFTVNVLSLLNILLAYVYNVINYGHISISTHNSKVSRTISWIIAITLFWHCETLGCAHLASGLHKRVAFPVFKKEMLSHIHTHTHTHTHSQNANAMHGWHCLVC